MRRKWTIEQKKALSIKCLGRTSGFKGRKHTKKALNIIRLTQFKKGISIPKGILSPAWRGGVAVNNKCVECNKKIWWGSKRCQKCNHLLQSQKRKIIGSVSLEKNPNWKGGITPLYLKIRHCDLYINWRKFVFKKDNYTCQECLKTGCYLEAHHKIRFSKILKNFLEIYNQFSPLEEKEILLRLAMKHEPFWDISNGKTLCSECHNKTKKGCVL